MMWKSAAFMALLLAAPAAARDGRYPWKANVDQATYEAEQSECLEAAKKAMRDPASPNPYIQPAPGTGTAGALGTAAVSGFARGLAQGKAFNSTYNGCFAAKGYSQRRLPEAEVKALRKLPKEERSAKIFGLISAPTPRHEEMPLDEYD